MSKIDSIPTIERDELISYIFSNDITWVKFDAP